jgi:hypothetical protein
MKYPIWPDEESCGWESNPAKKTKLKTKTAHRCGDRGAGAHKKTWGRLKEQWRTLTNAMLWWTSSNAGTPSTKTA